MTPKEKLDLAIKRANDGLKKRPQGQLVVKTYEEGNIPNLTSALYVIAELLDEE